jgi:ribonuclease HI
VAEYTALIEGLQAALEWHDAGELVEVRGDSQLAIRQMKGEYQVKSARIRPLHRKARELARQIGRVTWRWVPREQNEEADALSREAYQSVREEAGVGEAEGLPSALP